MKSRNIYTYKRLMIRHRITCWINPPSGKDLALYNITNEFIGFVLDEFDPKGRSKKIFNEASKGYEGMILKDFIIDLPMEATSAKKELMPKILKEHPEAKLASWDIVK